MGTVTDGAATPCAIDARDIRFQYGEHTIVDGLSLAIDNGEAVSLVGPSGCGKTTLLRLFAGLERPTRGECRLSGCGAGAPRVFYGFQDFDGFPWKTVSANVEMLLPRTAPASHRAVAEILERVGLLSAARKYPRELSGGMRKRLVLARCLASSADVVLLDEPFSSLDTVARGDMQSLVNSVLRSGSRVIVVVTHDLDEAIRLADRVLVCSGPPLSVVDEVPVGTSSADTSARAKLVERIMTSLRRGT